MVEMLVGLAVSTMLIVVVLSLLNHANSTIRTADSKLSAFQSAQAGFDLMTQKLSDATLNTYYDYDNPLAPTAYIRHSDLHFLVAKNSALAGIVPANANSGQSVFFQAPVGYSNNSTFAHTQGLLNACGYFVEYGPNNTSWPTIIPGSQTPRYRYRLMQAIQSTELNGIYGYKEGTGADNSPPWIASLGNLALPIAENIIALIILPQSPAVGGSISSDYQYNSRQGLPSPTLHLQSEQLPQILELTLVVIDEASATRLDTGSATPPQVIENALQLNNKFTDASRYAADLGDLETALIAAHINYHILTSAVTLRESKWSNQ